MNDVRKYAVVIERAAGNYSAYVPDLSDAQTITTGELDQLEDVLQPAA